MQKVLYRLKGVAERLGRVVDVSSNGVLSVDGVAMYSIEQGRLGHFYIHIMAVSDLNLKFLSYNCRGLNEIDYSYNFNMQRFILIDHFILSEQLFTEIVSKVTVLHDIDNVSDHDPVALELSLNIACLSTSRCYFVPKVAWYKAKPEDCCACAELLHHKLTGISIPVVSVLCRYVFCCDPLHREHLNRYIHDIPESCLQADKVTIPHTAEKRKENVEFLAGKNL